MIEVGDTVKVISTTDFFGEQIELISIGTICKVIEIDVDDDENEIGIMVKPLDYYGNKIAFWYLQNEVEKGHMEWVRDED